MRNSLSVFVFTSNYIIVQYENIYKKIKINSNENRPKTVVFDFGLIYNKFIGVKSETIGVRAVGR
jgi:hypothetical protein